MKKKLSYLVLFVFSIVSLIGCSSAEDQVREEIKAVKVIEGKTEEQPLYLNYIGTVNSKDLIKYSFKSPGKIANIMVEEGDKIKKGQALASLDISDLSFAQNAAAAKYQMAAADIKKAEDGLKYATDYFAKIESLYSEGGVSKDDFDKAKLNLDTIQGTYDQAIAQAEAAKTDADHKSTLISDATIYSTVDGSIVSTLFNEGENIGQGYPVVVVRSKKQILNVGLSQRDINKVSIGTKAKIKINDMETEGIVTNIDEAPDSETRTYNAEVLIKDQTFKLGTIGKLQFEVGKTSGIWIPISSVMAEGEDFVFVVNEDRAMKKTIELGNVIGTKVEAIGLEEGDKLVTEGMKNLKDGYKVVINE